MDSYEIEAGLETKCDSKTPELSWISLKDSFKKPPLKYYSL